MKMINILIDRRRFDHTHQRCVALHSYDNDSDVTAIDMLWLPAVRSKAV